MKATLTPEARTTTAQAAPAVPDVDSLAQFIRQIDGSHTMGTAALAERICEWLNDRKATEQAAPAVPQGWHISQSKIDGRDAVITNGPMGGCVAYKDADIPRTLPESILYELTTAMLASAPSQPDMQQREPWVCGTGIVTPHELREQSAQSQPVTEQETLVGLSIHGKELRKENIVYDGGPLDLTDCKLLSCHIEFSKAAARTVQFLAIAEQSQPGFLQPLFADAVRLTKPSQPVTLTDEVLEPIVKAIWDSGFAACRDTEIVGTHAQELAWGCVAANVIDKAERAIIAALREKEGK